MFLIYFENFVFWWQRLRQIVFFLNYSWMKLPNQMKSFIYKTYRICYNLSL